MTSPRRLRIAAVHASAVVFTVLAGCHDADTVTGVPMTRTTTPTPTPAPGPTLSNLTGFWEGTMQPKGCSGAFPVIAEITQTGNAVTGRLAQTGCVETFAVLDFTGTFQAGILEGTVTGESTGTIRGSLAGTTLGIHVYVKTALAPSFDLGPIKLHPGGEGN